ncbi:MAG: WYL domain-containing protein, partial [Actinobacteria bacterium]|nr:WYL domain-containing protein [Actinomycetota bacterium]
VAYLLTRQNRPVRAEQIRRQVEGYALMTDDAFKRRFYEDRTELELLDITISGESDDEDGGELYSLPAAAYYLPAVDLTHEELLALGACLLVLEGRFAYSKPLRLALLSLAEGRPELLEQDVVPPLSVLTAREALRASARLPRLQTAVADRKTVVFDYYAIGRDEVIERTVDPYGMLLVGDEWYLVGRCHRRRALRTFRLSRIRSRIRYATRRPHDFVVPDEVSLSDLRDRPPWQLDAGGATALIRVSERMAWWVEARYGRCGTVEHEPDGEIVFTTRFAAARPLVGWVLGLGEAAEILAPPEPARAGVGTARPAAGPSRRPAADGHRPRRPDGSGRGRPPDRRRRGRAADAGRWRLAGRGRPLHTPDCPGQLPAGALRTRRRRRSACGARLRRARHHPRRAARRRPAAQPRQFRGRRQPSLRRAQAPPAGGPVRPGRPGAGTAGPPLTAAGRHAAPRRRAGRRPHPERIDRCPAVGGREDPRRPSRSTADAAEQPRGLRW